MDFGHRITASATLAGVEVDGLILVVAGDSIDPTLSAPIAALINDAVSDGDLALKKGKSLYAHRPAGIAAKRVVVSVAADTSAKAFKSALAHALSSLKSSGAATLAIASASAVAWTDAHAEAAMTALADAVYLADE